MQPEASLEAPGEVTFESAVQNQTAELTFTITNDGGVAFTGLTTSNDVGADYNLDADYPGTELGTGEDMDITLTITVPGDVDNGERTIGTLTLTFDQAQAEVTLRADIGSKLSISNVDITVANLDTETNLARGARVEEKLLPDDTLKVDFRVNNLYASGTGNDIEDIEVTVTIFDIDGGNDLDFDFSEFDVEAEEREVLDTEFLIPLRVDSGDYELLIEAVGTSEDGVTHEDSYRIIVEVDKLPHALSIVSKSLSPSQVSCGDETRLDVTVVNIGDEEEEEAALRVTNSDLSLDSDTSFYLSNLIDDADIEYDASFRIAVPDDAENGRYPLRIEAFYNEDRSADVELIDLILSGCGESEEEQEAPEEGQQPGNVSEAGTGNESVAEQAGIGEDGGEGQIPLGSSGFDATTVVVGDSSGSSLVRIVVVGLIVVASILALGAVAVFLIRTLRR